MNKWRADNAVRLTEYTESHRLEKNRKALDRYHLNRDAINQRSKSYNRSHAAINNAKHLAAKWRVEHPDHIAAYNRAYKSENKHKIKAYYERNKSAICAKSAEYIRSHRQLYRTAAHRRRARKLNLPSTLTHQMWDEILIQYGCRCAYCLKPDDHLEQDHVTPLSRGGGHTPENIVPACRTCNASKHAKTPLEMLVGRKLVC